MQELVQKMKKTMNHHDIFTYSSPATTIKSSRSSSISSAVIINTSFGKMPNFNDNRSSSNSTFRALEFVDTTSI